MARRAKAIIFFAALTEGRLCGGRVGRTSWWMHRLVTIQGSRTRMTRDVTCECPSTRCSASLAPLALLVPPIPPAATGPRWSALMHPQLGRMYFSHTGAHPCLRTWRSSELELEALKVL